MAMPQNAHVRTHAHTTASGRWVGTAGGAVVWGAGAVIVADGVRGCRTGIGGGDAIDAGSGTGSPRNHSAEGPTHSSAVPAAINDVRNPPVTNPQMKIGTASTVSAARARVLPRIAW